MTIKVPTTDYSSVWPLMLAEARRASEEQPLMASFFHSNIINHNNFAQAISFYLAQHLASDAVPAMVIASTFEQALNDDNSIVECMMQDLLAHYTRDPACDQRITPLLYFKGYHAIQSYRIAHWLWQQKRTVLAHYFQSRIAQLFDVDIHPAASIAGGLMVDHATGVVIGETAIVGENVSMLHGVTLGGSGKLGGQRHPSIGAGVLLSVGAKILGNIHIGEGAKVGAGSLVIDSVPAYATVVGVPAVMVGQVMGAEDSHQKLLAALGMDHRIPST